MYDRDSTETARLLERLEEGDRESFDELVARYRDELCRFIQARLDSQLATRVDASDVVQEAHLEAFRRLDDYLDRRPMPFRIWLCKTAYERLLKERRRHREAARRSLDREVRLPDRSSLMVARRLLAGASTPSEQLCRKEQSQLAAESVSQLPETDREILVMRIAEDRPYDEIALLLEITAAAARQRYGRALLRLRKSLVDQGLLDSPS